MQNLRHKQETNILRFMKFWKNMASGSRNILVSVFLNVCPNVRLGVTSALTFLSLEHKRWVFIPVFMGLRFDGLYCSVAAIGRRSISGILLVPVSPSACPACIWKMKAKHHKKLPGRLQRLGFRRQTWPVTMGGYKHRPVPCVTGARERVTGP